MSEEQEHIADAIDELTRAIIKLGNAEASTPYGAIEGLGMAIIEGCTKIADAVESLAASIDTAFGEDK